MRLISGFLAVYVGLSATAALAQDKLDFTVGKLNWRCQHQCDAIARDRFVKVEQSGNTVTFTDAKGGKVTGTAKTAVRLPVASSGPSLRCQMNPSYCGKEPPPKTSYYRTIEIPDWKCAVSVQQINGEPDTPPPFKAQWLRFAGNGCVMGLSIWTTLTASQVRAQERKCGPHNINC